MPKYFVLANEIKRVSVKPQDMFPITPPALKKFIRTVSVISTSDGQLSDISMIYLIG
jgi:hypothetical protein